MQEAPFSVHSYTIDTLLSLLSESSGADIEDIRNKAHHGYFKSYFIKIGAQTIIAEYNYIDRDFLEDYASYYAKCFYTYKKTCTRLHFFSNAFTEDDFKMTLTGKANTLLSDLNEYYLGFIVVKPLPLTFIGRTCLRTYPSEGRRQYPVTRNYDVNLFGISLVVRTLAFQEQDRVVAACATSTLWSIFHGTGMLFQHSIPTPVEITKSATTILVTNTRALPNHGLTLIEMAHAIRSVCLEPYPIKASNEHVFKGTTYAYLKAGIPVALVGQLMDYSPSLKQLYGGHAIAITGYSLDESSTPTPTTPIGDLPLTTASRITKIYVHDDQIGPYARMEFDGLQKEFNDKVVFSLATTYPGNDLQHKSVRFIPEVMLIPVYHKIRIPFDTINEFVTILNNLFDAIRIGGFIPGLKERFEWDVFLSTQNDFKNALFQNLDITIERKAFILTSGMPRFIWRTIALNENKSALEFTFDATDTDNGHPYLKVIPYDECLFGYIKGAFSAPAMQALIAKQSTTARTLVDWIIKD